ncbi:MAG: hypothetical protein L6V93_12470 [Clostridiales bacterium]|nr:MAG: hypothetical protein L6V93_12470 [Clostridiales bacterium]
MQQEFDVKCSVSIDGYSDFIFVNRFGATQHQGTLNKAIKRIIRDCNDEVFVEKAKKKRPRIIYRRSVATRYDTRMSS